MKKLIRKLTCKHFEIINSDLVMISMMKQQLLMNKPIYAGMAILQGAAKKSSPPKFFCRYLGNCLEFCRIFLTNLYIDILLSKCQVIYDSVEKQRNYGLFKVTTYRFSSVKNVQATTL